VSAATHEHLIVFARWPEPGTTKTRLIPALGAAGAAEFQRRMTLHTLRSAATVAKERGVHIEVRYAGGDAARMTAAFGSLPSYRPQGDGDLGARLARSVEDAASEGAARVVVMGTDCPALTPTHLRQAFDALAGSDVVVGPAVDGGYTLIGVTRPQPALFDGIAWSTEQVLPATLRTAAAEGLSVVQLERLPDVDRPEDVAHAEKSLERTLSVIIPTRDEGPRLGATLDLLAQRGDAEVIVVDGGSSDDTVAVARKHEARVVHARPGRARQMNAGAAAASGGLLLFCHADTHLPEHYDVHVRAALARPRAVAGAFDLALRGEEPMLRRIERAVGWRSRALQSPYGDQSIFLRRTTFQRLGGYREVPIMEDHDLIRRARRLGRIVIAEGAASTSARFWRRHGMLRGTLINQAVLVGTRLGVAPETLAGWRAGRRG